MAGARRMPCGYSAKLGALARAPAAAIFLASPGRRCTPLSSILVAPLSSIPVGLSPSSVSCDAPRLLARGLGLAAAGRSADGPTGNAPRAGLRIRSAGAPHPAPPKVATGRRPSFERGCEHHLMGSRKGDNFFVIPGRRNGGIMGHRDARELTSPTKHGLARVWRQYCQSRKHPTLVGEVASVSRAGEGTMPHEGPCALTPRA